MFLHPVYVTIANAVPSKARVLDVGCGAGIFTSLLAHRGYAATGIDNDADLIALAREMVEYLRSTAVIEEASAFDLSRYHGQFDLVYSLGVVEHFDRTTTVKLVREQAQCAPKVVVVVPTRYTTYSGSVSDERLYTRGEVAAIVRDAGLRVTRSYVYGEVPTAVARNLERLLPRAAYTQLKNWLSYGMGVVVLGERR